MSIKVTPEFRARALAFKAGMVVLVLVSALLFVTFKAQTGMPFAKTTEVQALVSDVHSLRANDAVRQNSRRIGRVSEVDYQDGAALVTMVLDGEVKVYRDAHAAVWDLSALATKFVELNPGTPEAGALGATPIPASQTEPSADLYELLDVLDPKTRAAATSMLREVGGGVAGHAEDLHAFLETSPDLLADLGTVSHALASPEADLPELLEDVDALSSRFRGRERELQQLVAQSATTLTSLRVDAGEPLRQTLHRLPDTLAHTERAMSRLQTPLANTAQAMRALEPGAVALGHSEKDLRGFLRDSVPVARKVAPVAHLATPALERLTQMMSAARALAPRVQEAIAYLRVPLSVLAPYAPEMASLFLRGRSFVSQGPEPGVRYARLGVTPGVNTLTGGLIASGDQSLPQNQYPKPGEAENDRAKGLLPPGLPLGGN
ncbi:MlaD family protein [Nocardioides cavernaquae]|uniref:MCE family protein n=1 Tax=Nocardioides cavernaquae TaxID=2321396 RepID=A0A3A5H7V4_9ACTN|nr:MlaD family protein [Nocardioides cavernaquae]RJS46733.1 MCE family protein [Nocardioides cavernaquae]